MIKKPYPIDIVPIVLLVLAIGFNLFTLSPELNIKSEPNDNAFQYGLVVRMNEVLGQVVQGNLSPLNLIDHWVPAWASGYPLPFYYQHLPHLFVVVLSHLLPISLPATFNLIKLGTWILLPLSFYISALKLGFSKTAAAVTALSSALILTDGLYGADVSSFAWRGWGLSTQLFALFFAPLAISQIYQTIKKYTGKNYLLSVFLLFLTFSSHLAFGYIVGLSALLIPLCLVNFENCKLHTLKEVEGKIKELAKLYFRLFTIFASCFLLLSYWLIPLFLNNVYHNISFWDPLVKWNSPGFKEIIPMFMNGALFDFGRLPILTLLLITGLFVSLYRFEEKERFVVLAFVLWFILYFGRTTWGPLIDLLPMMKEMHIERFINGVHLFGLFLIGLGSGFVLEKRPWPPMIALFIVAGYLLVQPNLNYLNQNKEWLTTANIAYKTNEQDFNNLVQKIKSLPSGRVYAGRPGNWGRDFRIGSTQMYLALSREGVDINGYLPESWSLNSDPEPFFNEDKQRDYNLYNIRYLVTPIEKTVPQFAKSLGIFGPYNLSEIKTEGYFGLGTSNLLVTSKKENILNIIHLWMSSDILDKKEYPTLNLVDASAELPYSGRITMESASIFSSIFGGGSIFDFNYPPLKSYETLGEVIKETVVNEKYEAEVKINDDCLNCIIVFKMTYHPDWQATIDGQKANPFMVFPSFTAIKATPGNHTIIYSYKPFTGKIPLIILGLCSPSLYLISKKLKLDQD